jgi:GR25 family glycosyltransferase involved in LPS biosynthesis
MKLNDFFDKVYCINLDHREDRWERCMEIFDKLEIEVERVPALLGPQGWESTHYPHPIRGFNGVAGGTQTHINIISKCVKEKVDRFLVLEDDCEFVDNFHERFDYLSDYLDPKWELFYLGGMYRENGQTPEEMDHGIARIYDMMSSHAVGYRFPTSAKIALYILKKFPYLTDSIDGYLTMFQKNALAYAPVYPLVWQRADHSDVQGAHRDYTDIFKKPLL